MNENLTPQIVAALLQDGTVKMTGEEIAAAIADAIGALDKPYRFRGVATPDLAPGSIFEPTLFVAVAVGAYGSFSNQSVDVGQIAFFTSDDGGAWTRIEVYSATQAAVDAAITAALAALPVPKPIVLTGLPTAAMTTQDELDAIGLTADEMAAAAQGLRTGVVCLGSFYGIDMARENEFAFSRKSYSGNEMDALWAAYISREGSDISVDIAQI